MKKKLVGVLLLLVPMLILVIVLINKNDNYEVEYSIKGIKITEKYYSDLNMYYFGATYNNNYYEIAVINKYIKKQIINDIGVAVDNNSTCIYFKADELKTYPVCTTDNTSVSYSLLDKQIDDFYELKNTPKENKKYKKIKIESQVDESILIWNHYGFDAISKSDTKSIKLFTNETYADINSFQIDKYIVIPDYDQKYEFDKFYLIDITSNKVNTINLDDKISFNYYYLGEKDNIGYIFDKKNQKEYSINPKKEKIEVVSDISNGKVWDGKWKEISLVKLKNSEYKFETDNVFNYKVIKNNLYCIYYKGKNSTLISKSASDLIKTSNEKVFYTHDGKLYVTSPFIKNEVVLEYDEIIFNKGLSIYIY